MDDKTGPGITFSNPLGVGADDEIIDVPAPKPDASKMSPEAALAAQLGAAPVDEVIDIPNAQEWSELVTAVGGPEKVAAAAADFREVVGLFDMTEEAEKFGNDDVLAALQTWREVLASPEAAQEILAAIYDPANADKEPVRSYFRGNASPAVNDAIAKLWQAAHGEPVAGRAKGRGDGFVR